MARAASATISLNEIDPKALSPDKASWARYLVRRLERKSHDQTPRTVHLRNFKLVGASGGTVDSEGHFSEWIRTALNDSRLFRPLDQQAGMRKIPMETIRLRAIDVASKSQGSSTGLTTDLLRAEAELTGSVWLHEKRNIAEIHVWIKKRGGTDIAAATAEIPSNLFPETIIDPPAKPPVPPAPPNIVGPVGTISVKGQTVDITSTRGEGRPFYRIGEKIRIIVRLNQKAYTYLFNLGPHGKASLLYPVESDGSLVRGRHPVLEAGEALILPEDSATYTWAAAAPYGKETVWAVATEHPLTLPASLSREWAQSQILIERIREQGLRGDDRYAEAQIELITGP